MLDRITLWDTLSIKRHATTLCLGALLNDTNTQELPVAVEAIVDLVKGAKELAEFVRVEASDRRSTRRVREVQELIEALRLIYFSPRGVIKLLEDIADGSNPTEEQIAMILPNFNDYEFRVSRMLERIAPGEQRVQGDLTLRAERVLREISYGKAGVRSKVKDLLNEALTLGEPVSRQDASTLRGEILLLNTAIEDAEEALVSTIR